MTEYLYDKENPRSVLKAKTLGWSSFYEGMPNHFERTEMIARKMLKETDNDLAKISLDLNKTPDHGQRWRALKNLVNAMRNPFGLLSWRLIYQMKQNRKFSPYYAFVGITLFGIFWHLKERSKSKLNLISNHFHK